MFKMLNVCSYVGTIESFNFWVVGGGHYSWVVGFLLIRKDVFLWLRRFTASVVKLNLSYKVFVKEVRLWVRATDEYHEN